MSRIGPRIDTRNDTWKYIVLGGVLSASLSAATYWQSGSELSLSPVFLGGLLAGYLAKRATGSSDGVGARAGLVGGLPVFWIVADVVGAASGLGGPDWFVAAGTALLAGTVVTFLAFGFGLAALAGELGGRVGGWLAGDDDRRRPPVAT